RRLIGRLRGVGFLRGGGRRREEAATWRGGVRRRLLVGGRSVAGLSVLRLLILLHDRHGLPGRRIDDVIGLPLMHAAREREPNQRRQEKGDTPHRIRAVLERNTSPINAYMVKE